MDSHLHTIIVRGGNKIGPLPLEQLREQLRQNPVPDDSTLIIHTSLGDQVMRLGYHPILRASRIQPQDSVVCPYCETTQPTCVPGKHKCVRCGAHLLISDTYAVTLESEPPNLWYLSIAGLIGLLVFSKAWPNDIGLWLSLVLAFGTLFFQMLRHGVFYTRTLKTTAHEAPIQYAVLLTFTGSMTLLGLVLLVISLNAQFGR